jgi:tRNA1(Val) A37 N6-methylase TrmN6
MKIVCLLNLRIKTLAIYAKFLRLGLCKECNELNIINNNLSLLIKSLLFKYDFTSCILNGKVLLVGEGNLSFTCALSKKVADMVNVTATVYESYSELSEFADDNVDFLRTVGVNPLHNIDATKLNKIFSQLSFDHIIFQFPYSKELVNGLNPNYNLVLNFIKSASSILKSAGSIIITIVD